MGRDKSIPMIDVFCFFVFWCLLCFDCKVFTIYTCWFSIRGILFVFIVLLGLSCFCFDILSFLGWNMFCFCFVFMYFWMVFCFNHWQQHDVDVCCFVVCCLMLLANSFSSSNKLAKSKLWIVKYIGCLICFVLMQARYTIITHFYGSFIDDIYRQLCVFICLFVFLKKMDSFKHWCLFVCMYYWKSNIAVHNRSTSSKKKASLR